MTETTIETATEEKPTKFVTCYAGSGWLSSRLTQWKKPAASAFGLLVADILGQVFQGIYHLEEDYLQETDWSDPRAIELCYYKELATVDFDTLTQLVVICADQLIRFSISPVIREEADDYGTSEIPCLSLGFHKRSTRNGRLFDRCPTLETSAAQIRAREIKPAQL